MNIQYSIQFVMEIFFKTKKKKEKCNDKKELKNDIDDEFFSLLNSNKLNLKLDLEKQCFFS